MLLFKVVIKLSLEFWSFIFVGVGALIEPNLLRMKNSILGQSAPSLTAGLVRLQVFNFVCVKYPFWFFDITIFFIIIMVSFSSSLSSSSFTFTSHHQCYSCRRRCCRHHHHHHHLCNYHHLCYFGSLDYGELTNAKVVVDSLTTCQHGIY